MFSAPVKDPDLINRQKLLITNSTKKGRVKPGPV